MSYKVEYGEMIFILMQTKSSTKLLNEDRSTFCRTKKEDGINFRNIYALVKKVNNKQIIDYSCLQLLLNKITMVSAIIASQHVGL